MNYRIRPRYQIILVLLAVCCFSPAIYSQRGDESVVKGTLTDVNDAVIPNTTVSFQSQGKIQRAVTSQSGAYSIVLAPAIYQVSVDAPPLGFESLRRSAIRLLPKSKRTLNMQLTGKMTVFIPYEDSVPGEVMDHPASVRLAYTYGELTDLSKTGISSATVSFGTKCESKISTTFSSSPFNALDGARVTLTYDFVTVTANEVSFSKETRVLTACGNLTVEVDGKKRILPNCLELSVKDGRAEYREAEYSGVK